MTHHISNIKNPITINQSTTQEQTDFTHTPIHINIKQHKPLTTDCMEIRILLPHCPLWADHDRSSLFRQSAIKTPYHYLHHAIVFDSSLSKPYPSTASCGKWPKKPADRILQRNCYASITGSYFIHNLVSARGNEPIVEVFEIELFLGFSVFRVRVDFDRFYLWNLVEFDWCWLFFLLK